MSPVDLHGWLAERHGSGLGALHHVDTRTKPRGVRARISVLSEIPAPGRPRWPAGSRFNNRHQPRQRTSRFRTAMRSYLLYQTLLGTWPWRRSEEATVRSSSRICESCSSVARQAPQHWRTRTALGRGGRPLRAPVLPPCGGHASVDSCHWQGAWPTVACGTASPRRSSRSQRRVCRISTRAPRCGT